MRKTFHVEGKSGVPVSMSVMPYNEIKQRIHYGEHFILKRAGWVKAIGRKLKASLLFSDTARSRLLEMEGMGKDIAQKKIEISELRIMLWRRKMPKVPHLPAYAAEFGFDVVGINVVPIGNVLDEIDAELLFAYTVSRIKRLPTDRAVSIAEDILRDHFHTNRKLTDNELEKM